MTEDRRSTAGNHPSPTDGLDTFRSMVRAAFDQARQSGKQNWSQMTAAVLKNRLLSLGGGNFSEQEFGSQSFVQLVRRVPDLLEIVDSDPPVRLRLTEGAPDTTRTVDASSQNLFAETTICPPRVDLDWNRLRIRDDLWRAIIDYSGGDHYVFDPETRRARPRLTTDEDLATMSTVTEELMAQWRREFAESAASATEAELTERLREWVESSGRMKNLPTPLRPGWAKFLKKAVHERLTRWFEEHEIAAPNDLLTLPQTPIPREPETAASRAVETRQLRDLIIRTVRSMTHDELTKITLPAAAVLRISGKASRRNG